MPQVTIANNTGTALVRVEKDSDRTYRHVRGGESLELRSGAAVSISLPRAAPSRAVSPPGDDTALPAGLLEMCAQWDAQNLGDAMDLRFWFVHCVRGS